MSIFEKNAAIAGKSEDASTASLKKSSKKFLDN
jgi:hypothetical protein